MFRTGARSASCWLRGIGVLVVLLFVQRALAQDGDAGVTTPAPQLTPPSLLEPAEATYPDAARTERLEGSVLLELDIDGAGSVTAVRVLEPAGHGFDEAASEAAQRFRFSPAQRDSQPIAARIRYRYVFSLPPEPAPIPPPPPAAVEPPPPAPPLPASLPLPIRQPVEVAVRGSKSASQQLRESAEAVTVVDTKAAKQQAADLGEVLARTQGIAVQRDAGLGSEVRFSLNGMSGAAVKFFVDGVPLEESGYPAIADIPVNLVERVEIYRGVVPIRFGADALGGAINVVTEGHSIKHVGASYQVGSFGTHRVNAVGRYRDADSGLLAGAAAYFDYSKNDYEIDVRVPDDDGRPVDTKVRRFHDAYRGYGARLEVGLADRAWARRLSLTGFIANFDKEYQSNATQTVPFGEVRGKTTQFGATLRYDVDFAPNASLELTANYAHTRTHLRDLADWVYDWYGEKVRMRRLGGELDSRSKSDLVTWENKIFGRAILQWSFAPRHFLRLTSTPETPWRDGDERYENVPGERNRGSAKRRMITIVSGLEYEANLFSERLANIAFVKDYWQYNTGEEPALFVPGDAWATRENHIHRVGAGDSLRYRFVQWLYGKVSYEYATRLPEPEEFFGDAALVAPNYQLKPEVSHNGNLGLRAELSTTPVGEFAVDVNGFLRQTQDLVILQGNQRQQYVNVASASGAGIDSSFSWISPGRWLALNGALTWTDIRNTSDSGERAEFKGSRVPSDPWLFGSWGARLSFPNIPLTQTRLEPFYNGRYVHSYSRSWDDYGDPQFRVRLPYQVVQNAGITWILNHEIAHLTITVEVDNLGDAKVFDFFGAQRPGRAYYLKVAGDLR